MIIQELTQIQERCGYLPEAEMRALAHKLGQPMHRLHEVASFYPLYRLTPAPAVHCLVCRDMACHLKGAPRLQRELEALGLEIGGSQVVVEGVSCLGQCDRPVAVSINDHIYRGYSDEQIKALLKRGAAREELPHDHADRAPAPWKIDPYGGLPQYHAVRKFVE